MYDFDFLVYENLVAISCLLFFSQCFVFVICIYFLIVLSLLVFLVYVCSFLLLLLLITLMFLSLCAHLIILRPL